MNPIIIVQLGSKLEFLRSSKNVDMRPWSLPHIGHGSFHSNEIIGASSRMWILWILGKAKKDQPGLLIHEYQSF